MGKFVQSGAGELVQVDRHRVADQHLSGRRADEVLAKHVTSLRGQLDPLVPGPDQADAPLLVDDLGNARLGTHRQRAERIPVQVDDFPVLVHEPVAKWRELIGSVQGFCI